jgi:hypothetical protein
MAAVPYNTSDLSLSFLLLLWLLFLAADDDTVLSNEEFEVLLRNL